MSHLQIEGLFIPIPSILSLTFQHMSCPYPKYWTHLKVKSRLVLSWTTRGGARGWGE